MWGPACETQEKAFGRARATPTVASWILLNCSEGRPGHFYFLKVAPVVLMCS